MSIAFIYSRVVYKISEIKEVFQWQPQRGTYFNKNCKLGDIALSANKIFIFNLNYLSVAGNCKICFTTPQQGIEFPLPSTLQRRKKYSELL